MFDEQEPGKFELTPELAATERRLAQLQPSRPRVHRDQLMFDAGRAAALLTSAGSRQQGARKPGGSRFSRGRIWPTATALLTAASLLLAATVAWQQQALQVARQEAQISAAALHRVAAAPPTVSPVEAGRFASDFVARPWSLPADSGYLGARYAALSRGVGAIGPDFAAASGVSDDLASPPPFTSRQLLNELLPGGGNDRI